MKDFIKFILHLWPVILFLGYVIFYVIVFLEYKNVPMCDVPAWVYFVLYNKG